MSNNYKTKYTAEDAREAFRTCLANGGNVASACRELGRINDINDKFPGLVCARGCTSGGACTCRRAKRGRAYLLRARV